MKTIVATYIHVITPDYYLIFYLLIQQPFKFFLYPRRCAEQLQFNGENSVPAPKGPWTVFQGRGIRT